MEYQLLSVEQRAFLDPLNPGGTMTSMSTRGNPLTSHLRRRWELVGASVVCPRSQLGVRVKFTLGWSETARHACTNSIIVHNYYIYMYIYTSKRYSVGASESGRTRYTGIAQCSFYNLTLFPTLTFERSCWVDI